MVCRGSPDRPGGGDSPRAPRPSRAVASSGSPARSPDIARPSVEAIRRTAPEVEGKGDGAAGQVVHRAAGSEHGRLKPALRAGRRRARCRGRGRSGGGGRCRTPRRGPGRRPPRWPAGCRSGRRRRRRPGRRGRAARGARPRGRGPRAGRGRPRRPRPATGRRGRRPGPASATTCPRRPGADGRPTAGRAGPAGPARRRPASTRRG